MIRDLTDIGMGRIKPLITNANEAVPLDDEALAWAAEAEKAREDGRKPPPHRGRFLETAESKQHTSLLNAVKDLGLKAAGYDAVFTTYNQMQKIRGESAARHDMLERLADGGVVIFDESHNAGGCEPKINKQGEIIEDRARFARKLARKASAVFYSSATYAKRPEVMDLYFKTDLSKAVDDINQLPEVIKKGGIPLQQVVASMLSEAGQYIRRERSFAGVNYDVIAAPVDKEAAETVASVLSSIVDFDVIKQPAVEAFAETIKGAAQALGMDGATNVESANFTALMHNVIDQMLLNLKVDAAANEAIAALKCGEKPVITVANTMGAFLDEYAAENEIRNGDPIKLDFSGVLTRYLERSRRVTIKMPDKTVTHHYLSDDELGPSALSRYNEVKNMIEDGDFSGMAISPIDRIHQKIRDAGYSTAEITGRNQQIDYSGPVAIFRTRPGQETSTIGKKRAINGFNDGSVHALIINQSGSTGISLHASETFKNQQRRHMIIAQAEKNVDTHCLDTQTEILTPQGFKSYQDDFTEVAAFELKTGSITWQPVTSRVIRPLSDDEYMIGIEAPSLDIRVTNHHRMVYHTRRRREWAVLEAHEMAALGGGYSIPISGLQDPEYKLSLSDSEIQLIGWYLTDGSISQKSHQLMIWQSEHQPYHDHIKNSLEGCGLKYTIQRYDQPTQHKQTSARLCYLVSKGRGDVRGWGYLAEYLDKNFSPLLENLSRDQLAVLLETLHYGDGTKFENQPWTRQSYHIATGNTTFAEGLQSLCVRRGFKCNLAERDYNQNPLFFLHIKDQHKRHIGGRSATDRPTFQPVPHDAAELVWCIENPVGTLVIRRNGKVAIVGNCQMLRRVHRTGQVVPPRYTQLAADIPAEKRPAAVLAKKMASLNANTTAARGSAVTAKDVVDFLNEFGDKVTANLMREDQNLWLQLGQPAYEDEEAGGVKQDAMRRITGRIPILPIEQQEAVYKRLEDEYRDYIAFLEATGTNTLEAKTLDLQAETRSTDPLTTPKGGDSPFTRASAIEKARVRRLGKPMTSEQVAEMVRKSLGEQSGDLDKLQAVGDKRAKELMEQMTSEHAKFAEQRMEGFQLEIDGLREKVDKTEDSQEKTKLQRKLDAAELRLQTARTDTQKALLTWRALVQTLHPGSQVQLNTEEGSFYGVAVSLERKGEQKNPVALSGWRVNVAVADGARSIQFPLSQVMTEATQESHGGPIIASYADSMPIYNAETETFDRVPVAEVFDKGQSESMETRNIVTGNILAGFEAVKGKGQIVNYTDKDGNVRQGILMPRNWDREKELKQRDIVFKTADQALEFLSANGRLKTRDGDLVLISNAKGDLMLAANKAKSSGGKYYLNKKIIDAVGKDFVSGGGMMRAPVSKDQARKVIDLLASGEAMGQPTLFLADNMADKAREIVERSKGEGSAVEAGASASIGKRLKIDGISLEARKHAEDLAEQWGSNENTIQRRGATTEALMTALQTIANIEAPDPSGRWSLKELSATVGRIALAAIADAGGAEAVQDKEEGSALGKIAGIMASDQQGRLLSLQERIDDAVKIARATIEEIESRMLAQSVMVNAAEMAQPRQPSMPGHGIGW